MYGRFIECKVDAHALPAHAVQNQSRSLLLIILSIIAIFGVADFVLLQQSSVEIDGTNLFVVTKVAPFLLFLYVVSSVVRWRLGDDASAVAHYIRYAAQFVRLMVMTSALFIPLAIVTGIFVYLVSATNRPLMDGYLAGLDAALGFDWISFLQLMNGSPLVSKTLQVAYHALGPQVPLLFLLLGTMLLEQRILEFVAALAVSSLLIGVGMAAYPAAGAYAYFQPPPDVYSNFSANSGMWHFADLQVLRSGEPFRLILNQMQGLVTFPSFHTTLGVLIVYAVRDFRVLAICVGILNAVMIVATMPEGGHHLVDVLAGAAVALASISAVRYAARSRQHATTLVKGVS